MRFNDIGALSGRNNKCLETSVCEAYNIMVKVSSAHFRGMISEKLRLYIITQLECSNMATNPTQVSESAVSSAEAHRIAANQQLM